MLSSEYSISSEIMLAKTATSCIDRAFSAQISEAKSELAVVETAIKEKKAEGAGQFGWDGMAERISRAREQADKANRIKALEARVSLFERFVSLPQIKPLWEQFLQLIGKNKSRQKDYDR